MKKWFLLFLLIIPFVHSAFDTKVYSGWVDAKKNLTINGETYKFSWLRYENKTVVYLPDGSFMQLSPKKSKCELEGFYSICQTAQRFYYKGKEVPPDITSDINASLYLYINKTDQGLNFSKIFNSTMYANFSTNVRVKIEKLPKTREIISSVFYNDSYTNDFIIQNTVGCKRLGSSVIIEMPLFESVVLCEYDLIPKKALEYKNKVNLRYVVFEKTQNKKKEYGMSVKDNPFLFVFKYNKTKKIGEKNFLNFSYVKKQGVILDNFKVDFPDWINIEKNSNNLQKDKNSFTLLNKSSSSFFVVFNSTKENKGDINFSYIYIVNKEKKIANSKFNINYSAYIFDTEFLKKDNSSILRVSNGQTSEYSDVTIFLGNQSFKIEKLPKRSFREFEYISADYIFVSYLTEYGQRIEKEIVKKADAKYINLSNTDNNQNEEIKAKKSVLSDIKINSSYVSYAVVGLIIIGFFSFVFRRKRNSGLDKEIKELQKANFK